jgi:hypothetical protein
MVFSTVYGLWKMLEQVYPLPGKGAMVWPQQVLRGNHVANQI